MRFRLLPKSVTLNNLERRIQGPHKVLKYTLLSQERVKLRTSNWPVHSQGASKQKAIKKFGQKGAWAYPGAAQRFKVSLIIPGTDKATDFQFGLQILRVHACPLKILQKRERGRIQGLPKVFKYPLLSLERVKLRTSYFAGTFTGSIRTKAH